jgi:hypothetical protein
MNISAAKAISGLSCTATAAGTSVAWAEPIGRRSGSVLLPSAEINEAYECSGVLRSASDTFELDLATATGAVTGDLAAANDMFVFTGQAQEGETVTIGGRVYTWRLVLSVPAAANEIAIGASDTEDSVENMIAAITAGAGAGTAYSTGTTEHPTVTATKQATDTVLVTAKEEGAAGNLIATATDMENAAWDTEAGTLSGGLEASTLSGAAGTDIEGLAHGGFSAIHGI